jgi:hypothetical protein
MNSNSVFFVGRGEQVKLSPAAVKAVRLSFAQTYVKHQSPCFKAQFSQGAN